MGKPTTISFSNSSSSLHPPYFQMISDAILTMKERTGSSQQAISKLIEEKYEKDLPPNFKKTLSIQLKKFVKSERLVKVKNSFKISSAEKQKLAGKESPSKEKEKKKNSEKKGRKMKRLSQVKTPEGFKKKLGMTPLKRKNLNLGKGKSPAKKVRK